MIRLVKWWVRLQKINDEAFRLKSFMTEMIVSHLADSGVSMADYTVALEKVFAYIVKSRLKTRISFTDYYPASKLPTVLALLKMLGFGHAQETIDEVIAQEAQ